MKLRLIRIVFFALLCTLLDTQQCHAVISPHSLVVLASSVGPAFVYFFVIVASAAISLARKIKRDPSTRLWFFLAFVVLIACIILAGSKWHEIRYETYVTYKCCSRKHCDFNYCGELLSKEGASLSFSQFLRQRSVDLNAIDQDVYDSFQVAGIHDFYDIKLLHDTNPPSRKFYVNYPEMKKYLRNFDPKKKILFYFTHSDFASLQAYAAYNLGFDAYYTSLDQLRDDRFIRTNLSREQLGRVLFRGVK